MKELICIVCPKGCHLKIDEQNGYKVTGNSCAKGEDYGKNELLHPVRVVTSTVKITGGALSRCPVKTNKAIPKDKIFEAMELLNSVTLTYPVRKGKIVLKNILGTGANFVVTRSLSK